MKTIELTLTPEEYHHEALLRAAAAKALHLSAADLAHVEIVRRSLDSRRGIRYRCSADIYFNDELFRQPDFTSHYRDCSNAPRIIIVGAGPAGLFAALHALELGLKPVIVERGQPVDSRKKDIVTMVRNGCVNTDSNWCFGEGGAGTYSDGKLYTRSTKRGNVGDVLKKFVEHGASRDIMIDAHAHIGTDRLSDIIANMRQTILGHGGEIHFNHRVTDLLLSDSNRVRGVRCADCSEITGSALLLATGHSARDIYHLFYSRHWLLEAKPFALGVRVEHPQRLIDNIQYHGHNHSPLLPPAAYSLTTQVDGHGVFSFCMCPGGVIVPAATADGEQVVNGMSNANRNSGFANSGIAVTVSPADVPDYQQHGVLALLRFQQQVEHNAAAATGGGLIAPAQRLVDFCENRGANQLNKTNYMGRCLPVPLKDILPPFVSRCLQQAFRDFDRKMHGFYTADASLLAVESRTSSPVRIPRNPDGQHPQLQMLFPCGEGAGFAGGIVSSALDGINQIDNIYNLLHELPSLL